MKVELPLYWQIAARLKSTEADHASIHFVNDLDGNYLDYFLRGELTRIAVRRGDTVHIAYANPWETRALFDAYG